MILYYCFLLKYGGDIRKCHYRGPSINTRVYLKPIDVLSGTGINDDRHVTHAVPTKKRHF